MENQIKTTETVSTETEVETQPVTAIASEGEGEGEAVSVATTEVSVEEKQETPKLTPVTGAVGLFLVGLVVMVIARWRKKD